MAPAAHKRSGAAALVLLGLLLIFSPQARGNDLPTDDREAPRYGVSVELGNNYDPGHDIGFGLVTGSAVYDYGTVWGQSRPKELRFKVEGAAGGTYRPHVRTMASLGMFAQYYLNTFATRAFRPYFEAGIGAIYTDFRVPGQGLRFNFNPQLGLGTDLLQGDGRSFVALRLHHLSNGSLYHENRGVNSVVLQLGHYF